MTDQARQDARRGEFAHLLKRYFADPGDYDEGVEEDPRLYLSGEAELARYVCVTVNYTSHGEAKFFFLPTFDRAEDAESRAVEFADDDIFEELPVCVHDLDSGRSSWPNWASLRFTPMEVGV